MHKATRIGCSLLILALALANPLQSTGASAFASCGAAACVYLPSVQHTGVVYVVEKGHYNVMGVFSGIWGDLTASSPAINVVVEARVYDKKTNMLAGVASASPILTATLPGQLNPFYTDTIIDVMDHPDTYDVLTIISWRPMSGAQYLPITVVDTQTSIYGNVYARLRNDNAETLSQIRWVAWFTSLFSYNSAPALAPGETITMSFYLPELAPFYVDPGIHVSVQGIVQYP